MQVKVQQNIEFPLKEFESHGREFLETSYAVSLSKQKKNIDKK